MAARGVDYAPHEIDKALTTLAYYGGNSARAGKELGISDATLRAWRSRDHRERYLEICEREAPKLEALAANQAREIIVRSAEVEHAIIDRLANADETTSKELSELAGALQRLTTSKGINTTKLLELTGRPTQIVEHRDPKQAAAALARRLGVILEGTATEIPIAQLEKPAQGGPSNATAAKTTQASEAVVHAPQASQRHQEQHGEAPEHDARTPTSRGPRVKQGPQVPFSRPQKRGR